MRVSMLKIGRAHCFRRKCNAWGLHNSLYEEGGKGIQEVSALDNSVAVNALSVSSLLTIKSFWEEKGSFNGVRGGAKSQKMSNH